jgi:hypothetical protein
MSRPPISFSETLPPASLILAAVDQRIGAHTPSFNFYGTGIQAAITEPELRVVLDPKPRYWGSQIITPDMLKTLDDSRHLDPMIVRALVASIQQDLNINPLSMLAPDELRPKLDLITLDWANVDPKSLWKMVNDVSIPTSEVVCANCEQVPYADLARSFEPQQPQVVLTGPRFHEAGG